MSETRERAYYNTIHFYKLRILLSFHSIGVGVTRSGGQIRARDELRYLQRSETSFDEGNPRVRQRLRATEHDIYSNFHLDKIPKPERKRCRRFEHTSWTTLTQFNRATCHPLVLDKLGISLWVIANFKSTHRTIVGILYLVML